MQVNVVSFWKTGQEEQTIEEDLIQLRLIEGIYNASHRYKIMEQLQMFVLWTWTRNEKWKNDQHLGRLDKLLKKNHFHAVCKFKKKNVKRAEESQMKTYVCVEIIK